MKQLHEVSIKIANYKCFGDEPQGFEKILPLNIIIGRNNSGKSSLLEIVEFAINPQTIPPSKMSPAKVPRLYLSKPLVESDLGSVFRENERSNGVPDPNNWAYGSKWIGERITWSANKSGNQELVDLSPPFGIPKVQQLWENVAKQASNPLSHLQFKRLYAERDIREEPPRDLSVKGTGEGITNLFRAYINLADRPSELVKKVVLKELNRICNPDANFRDIIVQEYDNNNWEIHLDEENKGDIRLKHTGSGFKTILSVLSFLHILPHAEGKNPSDYVFCFEELENNVHPSLQRRLLTYIREFSKEKECHFFLTTHSSVVIDMFSHDEMAQIIHTKHDGSQAIAHHVTTYVENRGILVH